MRGVLIVIVVLIAALSVGGFVLLPAVEAAMFAACLCIVTFFGGLPVWAGHRTRERAMREAEEGRRAREITVHDRGPNEARS